MIRISLFYEFPNFNYIFILAVFDYSQENFPASVFNSKKCHLLPDAKPPKYIPQYFIRGDFAGDGADVVEGLADVLGDEFGG